MGYCEKCGIKEHLPFHCRRCKQSFCSHCRLPESHNCIGLTRGNIFKTYENRKNSDRINQPDEKLNRQTSRLSRAKSITPLLKKFKTFTILWMLFIIALFVSKYIQNRFDITRPILTLVITGCLVQTGSTVLRIFSRSRKPYAFSHLLFWSLIHSLSFWGISSVIRSQAWISHPIIAFGMVLIGALIRKISSHLGNQFWINLLIAALLISLTGEHLYLLDKAKDIALNIDAEMKQAHYNEMKDGFGYINTLRNINGKNAITWGERIYNLAKDRALDMSDRQYFDHTNPDGQCANSLKTKYGIPEYQTVAENIWGIRGGTENARQAINSWMESRGHRYNLLYSDHIAGAIACERGFCVFIGLHDGQYGLGGGHCSTGAQGEVYWETVGKQPGEV